MQYPASARQRRQLLAAGALLVAVLVLIGALALAARLSAPPASESSGADTDSAGGTLATAAVPAAEPARVSVLAIWGRLLVVLVATYGLLLGLRWLRREAPRRQRQQPAEGEAEVLLRIRDAVNLGGGREIHLIEIGEELLVVGSSQGQLALLAQIRRDRSEAREVMPAEPAERRREATPPVSVAVAVPEWEWEQRRARLIDALKQQAEE